VHMSDAALTAYLQLAYGPQSFLVPSRYRSSGGHPMHVVVVRSTPERMVSCKAKVRALYNFPHVVFKSACHATDDHTEAIVAAQMLLNANSVAYLHLANVSAIGVPSRCGLLSQQIAADTQFATRRLPRVVTWPDSKGAEPLYLHSHNFAIDTGAALAILGVRKLTDVDLIWGSDESHQDAAALVAHCGSHSHDRRGCKHKYGSHSPPGLWFGFHDVRSPEELLSDPTRTAFCNGLKFVAPSQLLAYKWRRFQARGETKDTVDAQALSTVMSSCAEPDRSRTAFCCSTHHSTAGACAATAHRLTKLTAASMSDDETHRLTAASMSDDANGTRHGAHGDFTYEVYTPASATPHDPAMTNCSQSASSRMKGAAGQRQHDFCRGQDILEALCRVEACFGASSDASPRVSSGAGVVSGPIAESDAEESDTQVSP